MSHETIQSLAITMSSIGGVCNSLAIILISMKRK